jgi:hypothetical protein
VAGDPHCVALVDLGLAQEERQLAPVQPAAGIERRARQDAERDQDLPDAVSRARQLVLLSISAVGLVG